MLRFFRTIRKKLIGQDNVQKYLLYAIGEILLLVVGILIALQVNNWNEQRKIQRSAAYHLTILEKNLREDLTQLLQLNADLNYTLLNTESLLNRFKRIKPVDNLFIVELIQVLREYRFLPNRAGIDILINSGELGVIDNSLQININEYYYTLSNLQERDNISNTSIQNMYEPYILNNYSFIWGKGNPHPSVTARYLDDKRGDISYVDEQFLDDKKLEALINSRQAQTLRQLSFNERAIDEAQLLLKMIEE